MPTSGAKKEIEDRSCIMVRGPDEPFAALSLDRSHEHQAVQLHVSLIEIFHDKYGCRPGTFE